MKCIFFILLITFFSATLQAQTKGKKNKNKSVCINEVYLYNQESDLFKYKNNNKIREWIEIYNGSYKKIWVSSLSLTDDLAMPMKWQLKPWKKKDKKIKRRKYLAVYINGTGKRNRININYETKKDTLYLIRNGDGKFEILDTLILPMDAKFPYSRYPDGSNFKTIDVLTPGYGNLLLSESEKKRSIGVAGHIGMATSTAVEFRNATRPILADAAGFYYRTNFRYFSIDRGVRFAKRGYGISYDTAYNTTKGYRELRTKGKQTLYYLDFSLYISTRLTKNFSLFFGPAVSFKLKSILAYETDMKFTYFSNGQQVITKTKYYSDAMNDALDYVDFAIVMGLRYNWKGKMNFSTYYMRDVGGSNWATGYPSQVNSGFYFTIEVPMLSSKRRVKKNILLQNVNL